MGTVHFVWAAVVVAAIAGPATAQSPSFMLDAAAMPTQDVTLTVQSPTILPVKIFRSGGAGNGNVTLDLSNFTNEQGLSRRFTISVEGVSTADSDHLEVLFGASVLSINLHIPELPIGGKYTGRLILTASQAQPVIWRFVLTPANELRPATLVLDQNVATVAVVRPWCLWLIEWCPVKGDVPVVTVHARDKSGNWPLDGIMARLEQGLKAPGGGFDLKKHFSLTFNNENVPDIFTSPLTSKRRVDPRGQATVSLTFNDLEAGEYTIPLRFSAMNSGEDDLQRLTVTVQVRNNLIIAILVLLAGALLSFLATRVVTMLRQRAAFLDRIRALRPAWLGREPPTLSVIWLRATLRQAEDLSKRYWLTGQNEIDSRLTGAAGMLAVLNRVRQVRDRINAIPDAMVKRRAIWQLDNITQRLPAAPLTDQDVARFKAELDAFDSWCDPDLIKREAAYWGDILSGIRNRYSEVQVASLPEAGRELTSKLLGLLNEAMQREPPDLQQKIAVEEVYARLSLVWESREHEEWVKQIVDLHKGDRKDWAPIEKVYKIVDDGWWGLLTDTETRKSVEVPSGSMVDSAEAYETVVFKLNVEGDLGLLRSYLMQKKLTYRWEIDVLPSRPIWKRRIPRATSDVEPVGALEAVSTQPQVAQYSPRPGELRARVNISYAGRQGPQVVQGEPIPIVRSSDFGVLGAFERADAIGFFVVLLTSIISGITIYALSPTFGTLKEYLALFTWGAGLDQGKNFLQSLAAYSSATPGTAPATVAADAGTPAAQVSGGANQARSRQ